ncbi:hypothetical protein [Vagococcus carniphilus]|uniref:hypothetical protein n=1 Tax=Vagococcus carniphilus TaxID=218144 RepID=UPI002890F05F|nr:hypothetical protein [Vagococcus carniphilus]MDT2865285.1 hypothetical protein [Vagococcus carniphilus]
MFNRLNEIKNKEELVNLIVSYYIEQIEGNYIPAIIEIGNYISDDEEIDFYSKIVVVDEKVDVDTTWLVNNLTGVSLYTLKEEKEKAFNVITQRNYNHKDLYELNPVLVNNNMIWEKSITNDVHVNQYIENHNGFEELPLFKYSKQEKTNETISSKYLLINKEALADEISFETTPHVIKESKIALEFELRFKDKLLNIEDYEGVIPSSKAILGGYLDIVNIDGNGRNAFRDYTSTSCRGTIVLDFENIEIQNNEKEIDIKVVNLDDMKIRDLNPSNYNDDTNAGLIVFDKKIIPILREEYLYTGTTLIPKRESQRGLLIDELEDIIVFWEGEFNKLPREVMLEIEPYNLKDRTSHIISDMMFAWQLAVDFNYLDKALPSQKLGDYTYENYQDIAFEYKINFWQCDTSQELKLLMEKLELIYEISPRNFDGLSEDIKHLKDIYENKNVQLPSNEINILMQKYCYAILNKVRG